MSDWSIYLLRCRDGSLYTGVSNDVAERFKAHQQGCGAKYTRGKGPLELVYTRVVGDRSMACKLEHRVKKMPRSEKERLIRGEIE
ncbi:MAG: GIY-YIG nuclease family protein [Vulcanimicrobiota bacterium]